MNTEFRKNRFEIFSAFMIAVVTILSALTAWRANVADGIAGNADFEGVTSSILSQEARIVNGIHAYEHYRAYTSYYRYNELGNIMYNEGDNALLQDQSGLWGVALGLQYSFFPPRYVNRDGSYDVQRELDELWADQAQQTDLNPTPHFQRADGYRDKSIAITAVLIVFATAFFLFTAGQAIRNRLKYLFALGGILVTLAGAAIVILIEFAFL